MSLSEDAFERSDKPLLQRNLENLVQILIRSTLNPYRNADLLYQTQEIPKTRARLSLQQSQKLLPLAC